MFKVDTNMVAHPKSRTQAQKFVGRQGEVSAWWKSHAFPPRQRTVKVNDSSSAKF
jgi:hypothetical protein